VASVVRPPDDSFRAHAALAPKAIVLAYARTRRRRLPALPIAVTGSVGKTTTKDLLVAALRTIGPTAGLRGGLNRAWGLAQTIAGADRHARFLVQEIGVAGSGPGSLDELLWALEPRVSIVTAARSDHVAGLGGPDGAAREKVKAVTVLPETGLAVLNADDPRIRAMATSARCRVVLAGRAEDADVRIVAARLGPDARLVVRLADGGDEHTVTTRLVGLHWETAVALAFAAATRLGADPARAGLAIGSCEPSWERLSLVEPQGGPRFLVDTAKGTEASMGATFAALGAMPARRRIAVIGSLIDFAEGTPAEHVARVTGQALAVADEVHLYGGSAAAASATTLADPRVRRHDAIRALADGLWTTAGPGDVVLVKGALVADHLVRVALPATHDVRCWTDDCERRIPCTDCRSLGPPLR